MSALFLRRTLLGVAGGGLVGCASAPSRPLVSKPNRRAQECFAPAGRPALLVDVHCHTFNARDLPMDGFIRSLAQGYGMPSELDGLLARLSKPFHEALVRLTPVDTGGGTPAATDDIHALGDTLIAGILNIAKATKAAKGMSQIVPYVKMAKTTVLSREDMAARIAQKHPGVSLFTPSLVDFAYWIDIGKQTPVLGATTPLEKQVEYHAEISRRAAVGDLKGVCGAAFHPFVPFNPMREISAGTVQDGEDGPAMRIVKQALANGFVGVKIYPASGFKPYGNERLNEFRGGGRGRELDRAMDRLFAFCESEQVPILTHASSGNGFRKDAAWRGSPWAWRTVLNKYKNLRLCFGHFGGLEGIDAFSDPLECVAWAEGFVSLMKEHKNVYADISNSDAGGLNKLERDEYQRRFLFWLCRHLNDFKGKASGASLARKLVYGSDWWMGIRDDMEDVFLQNIVDMVKGAMDPINALLLREQKIDFPSAFFGTNAMQFLGIRGDDGATASDGNAKRLRAFYDTHANGIYPSWLA